MVVSLYQIQCNSLFFGYLAHCVVHVATYIVAAQKPSKCGLVYIAFEASCLALSSVLWQRNRYHKCIVCIAPGYCFEAPFQPAMYGYIFLEVRRVTQVSQCKCVKITRKLCMNKISW